MHALQPLGTAMSLRGHRTASGAPFNPNGMTAAHRSLPFGTWLVVGNPRTGKSVRVTVNDRGPFTAGLTLDLSHGAARVIGMKSTQAVTMRRCSGALASPSPPRLPRVGHIFGAADSGEASTVKSCICVLGGGRAGGRRHGLHHDPEGRQRGWRGRRRPALRWAALIGARHRRGCRRRCSAGRDVRLSLAGNLLRAHFGETFSGRTLH